MKSLIFTFFLFIISTSNAQNNEEYAINELAILHSKTKFVRDSINKLIKESNQEIETETDENKKKELLLVNDSLWNVSDRNDIEELKNNIEYCKKHPSCAYSFELVNIEVSRQSGKNFYHDFEYIYNNASEEIRESESGLNMAKKLLYFKKSMVGSYAPKFSGIDINNHNISLDDYHDKKYVLVDFWASYCAPCREEFPFMNSLRQKYKNDGFEIISISIDQDLTKWENAIIKDKIENWKHFSAVQNNSSVNKDYFVNGIPHKVLIDKNGKIVGKWKASGELNKRDLENLLTQIFGY